MVKPNPAWTLPVDQRPALEGDMRRRMDEIATRGALGEVIVPAEAPAQAVFVVAAREDPRRLGQEVAGRREDLGAPGFLDIAVGPGMQGVDDPLHGVSR